MSLKDEVVAIERQLWTGGAGACLENLDAECPTAFTEMSGAMSREEVAGSADSAPRWRDVEIDVQGVLQPNDDLALLTYRASAARGEGERFRALISSAYVRREAIA